MLRNYSLVLHNYLVVLRMRNYSCATIGLRNWYFGTNLSYFAITVFRNSSCATRIWKLPSLTFRSYSYANS